MAPGPIPATPHRPGRRFTSFSPTELRAYRSCPEQFYRKHIAQEKIPRALNRAMLRGSAAHKVLARIFTARQDGEILEFDERALAEQFLPRFHYQKAAELDAWEGDIEQVLELVRTGLAKVPGSARIISVERSYDYVLGTSSRAAGARIVGKVDLLIRHAENVYEHIEFKTGGARPDPFQEIICRIGVCAELNPHGLPVLSTTYQLSTGAEACLDGGREVLRNILGEIEETIQQIWNATSWPAREGDGCAYCDFRETLCSLHGEWSRSNRLANSDS